MKMASSESNSLVSTEKRKQGRWYIPARYILIFLGFWGFCNVYALKVNLSVGLVAMINHTAVDQGLTKVSDCPRIPAPFNSTKPVRQEGIHIWDPFVQGNILGAFYYGYIITNIPGGRIAEMFGAKWVFGLGIFATGIFSFFIPIAANYDYRMLMALRVVQGFAEGVHHPAMEAMVAHWFPITERITSLAFMHSGMGLGSILGNSVSGLLADSDFLGGWPSIFYVFGLITSIWFLLWCFLAFSTPHDHPRISAEELHLIDEGNGGQKPHLSKGLKIPVKSILLSPKVLAVFVTHFGTNWLMYTLLNDLPTYLGTVLYYDIKDNGLFSSLPYMGSLVVGCCSGLLADYIRRKKYLSATNVRKLFNGIGMFIPAIILICVPQTRCNGAINIALLSLAGSIRSVTDSGYMSIPVDMAPDYAGTIFGISNAIGNIPGFLAPTVTGAFTQTRNTTEEWSYVFYIAGGITIVTGVVFQLFASAEVQPWAVRREDSKKLKEKHELTLVASGHEKQRF